MSIKISKFTYFRHLAYFFILEEWFPLGAPEFVQNVKMYCKLRGVKPTIAMRESGVGTSFINNIEKGSAPSVFKVQQLAAYLNVTTSELLGEAKPQNLAIQDQPYLVMQYNQLSPESQDKVRTFINFLAVQEDIEKK